MVDSAAVDSAVAAAANTADVYKKAFSLYRSIPDSLSRRASRDHKLDTAPRKFRVRTTFYRTTRVAIPPCNRSSAAAAADFHPRPRSPLASLRTPPAPTRARMPISRASRSAAPDRRVDVPPTSRAFASPHFCLRVATFECASPLDRRVPRPTVTSSRRAFATGVRDGCSLDSQSVRSADDVDVDADTHERTHANRDDFDRSVRRPLSVVVDSRASSRPRHPRILGVDRRNHLRATFCF